MRRRDRNELAFLLGLFCAILLIGFAFEIAETYELEVELAFGLIAVILMIFGAIGFLRFVGLRRY
jgi:H+/gluconate symporter-like permease